MKLTNNIITTIIANESYGVCYEPIIDLKDMQIKGYEALSRFKYKGKMISPAAFFKCIHEDKNLFFHIEAVLKKFQIENRPKDKKLFLNLDPDIAVDLSHISFWVKLFEAHKDLNVEIIENSDEESAKDVEHFMDWMDEYKISYVYDDFAKPNSMYFTSLLCRAKKIKLYISFLSLIKKNPAYIEVAKGMVRYARLAGKKTILEGVETKKDLELAREVDLDYIQGYLFKNTFIKKWKNKLDI